MYRTKLLPVLFALVVAACAVSPTGRQQFLVMSPQQVNAMGVAAFDELKRSKKLETNRRANAYVQCVADAIIAETRGRPEGWEVLVFRDSAANAFALPGGKIGVYKGLLAVTKNQDQLATVIGHEVGHVLAQHANERVSQEYAVQGGLAVIGAVAGGSSGVDPQVMRALGLGAEVGILLPFSRAHETEADVIGLDLMARAGFDPRESAKLWRNMSRASGTQPMEFLSTHPAHGTRIRDLEANMGPAMQAYKAARARGKRPRCDRPS